MHQMQRPTTFWIVQPSGAVQPCVAYVTKLNPAKRAQLKESDRGRESENEIERGRQSKGNYKRREERKPRCVERFNGKRNRDR